MADQSFNNEYIWRYESLCREKGIWNLEKIENVLRVLKTREALSGSTPDAEQAYMAMQNATTDMDRFKGDAALFYEIYQTLRDITPAAVLHFISSTASADRGALTISDALTAKFGEYITETVETVFIPDCEEFGDALLQIIEEHPSVKFTLGSRSDHWLSILSFIYGDMPNVEMIAADIYRDGFTDRRFDLILSVPIFGARSIAEGQDFICKDSDMIAVQNLLYHIGILEGRLVIVLPAKITFGSGSIASLREYVRDNYKIDEISILPSGLFLPSTSIRTYLFAFSNGTTEEVLVKKYESKNPIRRNEPCKELVVADEEILFPDEFDNMTGWNVDMAFEANDEDLVAYTRSYVKKARLEDIATVFRGKAVNSKTEGGKIGVINISNLTEGGIEYEKMELLDEEERKVARYALEDGDVLVTARGTTVKVAVFEKQEMTCIPSANFNVIRPNNMVRGMYLKLFLESPVGTKLLKGLQRGTTVMNINFKDLLDLEIPMLPIEAQDALIAEYAEGLSLYRQTISAAEVAWAGVQKEIQSKLY